MNEVEKFCCEFHVTTSSHQGSCFLGAEAIQHMILTRLPFREGEQIPCRKFESRCGCTALFQMTVADENGRSDAGKLPMRQWKATSECSVIKVKVIRHFF